MRKGTLFPKLFWLQCEIAKVTGSVFTDAASDQQQTFHMEINEASWLLLRSPWSISSYCFMKYILL